MSGKDYRKTGIYPEKFDPKLFLCEECNTLLLAAWLPAICPKCSNTGISDDQKLERDFKRLESTYGAEEIEKAISTISSGGLKILSISRSSGKMR